MQSIEKLGQFNDDKCNSRVKTRPLGNRLLVKRPIRMTVHTWSTMDFDEMSWHDNHVHALRIVEGVHGAGQLILDVDYIVEWLNGKGGGFQFRIIPSLLTFADVTNLRISLDYEAPTAALGPFSIHAIERRREARERYEAQVWRILINWPVGEVSFEAQGFEQRGTAAPVLSDRQVLRAEERGA